MTTEVIIDSQSVLIGLFHIITHTKLAKGDKSTEVRVDHHLLYLLCVKIISKGKVYWAVGFNDTVYRLGLSGLWLKAPEKTHGLNFC